MIKIELQMEIEAPPEKVFDYLCYLSVFPWDKPYRTRYYAREIKSWHYPG